MNAVLLSRCIFDLQTVRGKLREYEREGLLTCRREGRSLLYRLTDRCFFGLPYYDRLRAGESSTTSQISPSAWQDAFMKHVQEGEQVLCLVFSSALSGTFSSACVARDMVLEEYPDAVIEVVDTLGASAGQGLMVFDVLENRGKGMDIHANAAWIRENLQHYAHWFTVDDLKYLRRGGRISAVAAIAGTMLDLKPIITETKEGKLVSSEKVRGRKQALRVLVDKAVENIDDPANADVIILHADAPEDAERLESKLREKIPALGKIDTYYVGPVIGAHCGPGTVALCFFGKERPC